MNLFFPTPAMVSVFAGGLGNHMRPLLALAAHRKCLLALQDQERAPFTVPSARPWVVIIGDDPADPETSLGPQGFHTGSLAALMRAATDVTINASEIIPELYERQAVLAAEGVSGVIIETRPQHADAWMAFVAIVAPGKMRMAALLGSKSGAA